MAIVDINGALVEFPDDLNPAQLQSAVSQAASQLKPKPIQPLVNPVQQFATNAVADAGANIKGNAELASYAFPPLAAMKSLSGENMYRPDRINALGKGVAQGIVGTPKRLMEIASNPTEAMFNRPFSTALDVGTAVSAAGSLARLAKPLVTAGQLESLSGAMPGSLKAAYERPGLVAGRGKKAISADYQTLKTDAGNFRQELMFKKTKAGELKALEHKDFVNNANNAKNLTPIEALEARKSLDKIKRTLPPETFNSMRDKFDKVAKESFASADKSYKDAITSESLRQILPQNKYGGTSAFKTALATTISKLADDNSGIAANVVASGFSPAVQGLVAAGTGAVAKAGARSIVPAALASAGKATPPSPETEMAINKLKAVSKTLTVEKAKEYLKKALGKAQKARELARADGWEIPR